MSGVLLAQDAAYVTTSAGWQSWRSTRDHGLRRLETQPRLFSEVGLGWEIRIDRNSVLPIQVGLSRSALSIVSLQAFPLGYKYDSLTVELYHIPIVFRPAYLGLADGVRVGLRAGLGLPIGNRVTGISEGSLANVDTLQQFNDQRGVDGFGATQFEVGFEAGWRFALSEKLTLDIGGAYSRGLVLEPVGQAWLRPECFLITCTLLRVTPGFTLMDTSGAPNLEY